MTAPLYVIQDDIFFAERVRIAARALGLEAVSLTPEEAGQRRWEPRSVAVIQITLNPERQLDLVQRLAGADPSPKVVAVSGHLESGLRARAKALGATLAPHSGMTRVLARACGLSGDDAPDAARTRPD
jgi:ActR/RegA family two-component response regulator